MDEIPAWKTDNLWSSEELLRVNGTRPYGAPKGSRPYVHKLCIWGTFEYYHTIFDLNLEVISPLQTFQQTFYIISRVLVQATANQPKVLAARGLYLCSYNCQHNFKQNGDTLMGQIDAITLEEEA